MKREKINNLIKNNYRNICKNSIITLIFKYYFIIIYLSLIFSSCTGPGYYVKIHVGNSNMSIVGELEIILIQNNYIFSEKTNNNEDYYGVDYYKSVINSNSAKWDQYTIYAGISCDYSMNNSECKGIDIYIDNQYHREITEIKSEIDLIGDIIYEYLCNKVGSENVDIERGKTNGSFI